jgi:hypothetical protein
LIVLTLFSSCQTCKPIVKTEYVLVTIPLPPKPNPPEIFDVHWYSPTPGAYCVDSTNGMNLYLNVSSLQEYTHELENILSFVYEYLSTQTKDQSQGGGEK